MCSRSCGWPAEERCVNALAGIRSNPVAGCKKQAASRYPDVTIGADPGFQLCDPPWRARSYATHGIEVDCSVGGHASNRNDSDPTPEFKNRCKIVISFVLCGGQARK